MARFYRLVRLVIDLLALRGRRIAPRRPPANAEIRQLHGTTDLVGEREVAHRADPIASVLWVRDPAGTPVASCDIASVAKDRAER